MLRTSRLGLTSRNITRLPRPIQSSKLSMSTIKTEAEENPSSSTFRNPTTIFVRPWEGVPTMVHVFAIVRSIEKMFGKIDEIIVPRDSNIPNNYLPYFIATFAWEEDAQAIPLEGKVIQVPRPAMREFRPGGIGLSDLESYLDAGFRHRNLQLKNKAPEIETDSSTFELMDVKLERARLRYFPRIVENLLIHRRTNPYRDKTTPKAQKLAKAIVSFGGFTNPALPPNAPPSSFARVVESWYNVMTPEARDELLNRQPTRQPEHPSDPHFHIDNEPHSTTTTPSIPADPNNSNDAILESTDESVLIPESTPTMEFSTTPKFGSSAPTSTASKPPVSFSSDLPSKSLPDFAPSLSPTGPLWNVPQPPEIGSEEVHRVIPFTPLGSRQVPKASPTSVPPSKSTSTTQSPPRLITQPQVPKLTKRERMLMAVREAGKVDAMKNKTQPTYMTGASDSVKGVTPTEGSTTAETALETGSDDKDRSEGPASWWSFLVREQSGKAVKK